jgi:hypothetical protein
MKRMRILGLCLVAAFALSVVAVSSASAAPAFYECAKDKGGKYEDKACSKEAKEVKKEKYELKEGIAKGKVFKGKGKKATLHTPAIGGEITCTGFKDEGKLSSPTTEEKVVSIFTGCATQGKKCVSAGEKAGTIKTFDLDGGIGEISGGSGVGVDLKAETGKYLAEFECEGLLVKVEGSVIGEQTGDINKFSKVSHDIFAVTAEGYQKYKSLVGGPTDVLESFIGGAGPFESGQEAEAENKGEELEIKT